MSTITVLYIFFSIYIQNNFACLNKNCRICPNHTLCKYEVPGPNPKCVGYVHTSILTQENINTIVDQINRRRNFIALGQSTFFPSAANMKKIIWSDELAIFAQRWVDQCDQSLQPDKEDQCRDMETTKVSQSIATIMGWSPGVNVKSFVEMWYMQSLNYYGSVTYYNHSQDYKTKYFTQLIWAETDKVGCGKARFFVKYKNSSTLVERVVCNFAPSGNLHGKPVYTIGYAATQCDDDMINDKMFPGLCSYNSKTGRLFTVKPDVTSLLRIRNQFNDSIEQEIDPVYNNLKQTSKDYIEEYISSNKSFNFVDNSFDAIKRSYPFENENDWLNNRNHSRHYDDFFHQQQKVPSGVLHGHHYRSELDSQHPKTNILNPLRHDILPSVSPKYHDDYNHRSDNIKGQCTRTTALQKQDFVTGCNCKSKILKCTRGQKSYCQTSKEKLQQYLDGRTTCRYLNDLCTCSDFQTSRHSINVDNLKRHNIYYYHDPSNIGEIISKPKTKDLSSKKQIMIKHPLITNNENYEKNHDYSEMKRSITKDDITFKPFWQIDGFTNSKHQKLKTLRYTTLPNKKLSKSKRTGSRSKIPVKTELITIKNNGKQINKNLFTEKYLSFDELLHLRKNKSNNYSGRRHDEQSRPSEKEEKTLLREGSATKESATEYTANTPFIRMKHCTRKLTCTWTAVSLTDSAGSVIGGGGLIGNIGSRTPPGYVEGCTRTSTCTRDFMDRNKMATLPVETTISEMDTDDEDYCERRSLNKRNSNKYNRSNDGFKSNKLKLTVEDKIHVTENPTNRFYSIYNTKVKRGYIHNENISKNILNYRTIKRENKKRESENEENILTYGDLYYLVLNKILEIWKRKSVSHSYNKCLCNVIAKLNCSKLLLFIITLFIIFY